MKPFQHLIQETLQDDNFSEEEKIMRQVNRIWPLHIALKLFRDCFSYRSKIIKHKDQSISVIGSVYLNNGNFKRFPFKFRKVTENFDASYNQLSTLEGGPIWVDLDTSETGF